MAAQAVQLAAAAIPFLFKLFGSGKNKETKQAEAMPDEFMSIMKQLLGDANMDKARATALWDNYVQRIQDMADQGYGTPEDIMGQGSSVVRDEGQGQKRKEETEQLDERFRNGPNAQTTRWALAQVPPSMPPKVSSATPMAGSWAPSMM
jgi:hypothetical protein